LIPDARAHPDDVALIYDTGILSANHLGKPLLTFPGRISMDDMPTIEAQDGEEEQQMAAWKASSVLDPDPRVVRLRRQGPVRILTVADRPLELTSLRNVRFSLSVGQGIQRPTGVMLVLFGLLFMGITG